MVDAQRSRSSVVLIDGIWRDSDSTFRRENPYAPSVSLGEFAATTPQLADEALATVGAAARGWARTTPAERAAMLRRAAVLLRERAEEISQAMVRDIGKPIRDCRGEVARTVEVFDYFAADVYRPVGEVFNSDIDRLVQTRQRPLGTVCIITPWNFPLVIPAWKIAPALAYGNVVCWKPSELSPVSTVMLADLLLEAGLPPGVLSVVGGPPEALGDDFVTDPRIDGLSFTGSNPVGEAIARRLGPMVPVQLELGGKNSITVLADGDLEAAASTAVEAATGLAGQRCTGASVVLADERCVDQLVLLLRERMQALVIGDPSSVLTDVGPLASLGQLQRAAAIVDDAADLGLEPLVGGTVGDPDDGYFMAPTLYAGVPPDSKLARDESFAPFLAVTAIRDLDAALEVANATRFGLSASIFTASLEASLHFIDNMEAGLLAVNRPPTGGEIHVPFGGLKASGSQMRELGSAARRFFTVTQSVYLRG